MPKVNISSKIEIHSPTPPAPFDVWVSGSYIRHQGQSLKRQVNLQTDIRGSGFSCAGRAERAERAERAGVRGSTTSSSVKHERNRQLGHLGQSSFIVGFVTHIDLRAGAQTARPGVLTKVACPPAAIVVCMSAHQSPPPPTSSKRGCSDSQ